MPKTTVGAIISTQNGNDASKILLTRRNIEPFKNHWCLPGGNIELYESAREAIIREVKEETGLDFEGRFFAYFDEIIPEYGLHAVVLIFTGKASGIPQAQPEEVAEIAWFSLEEARSLTLAFNHNDILDRYAFSQSLAG